MLKLVVHNVSLKPLKVNQMGVTEPPIVRCASFADVGFVTTNILWSKFVSWYSDLKCHVIHAKLSVVQLYINTRTEYQS